MGIRYKRSIIAVSALTVAGWLTASAQTPADSAEVSLDDCLRIALSESPTLRVADLDIVRVDYSRKETLAQLRQMLIDAQRRAEELYLDQGEDGTALREPH